MTVREEETGRGRATGNHFCVRAAERVGEQMKAHFPLIKSSENIPFVSATAAETGPGLHSQPTVSVDYVAPRFTSLTDNIIISSFNVLLHFCLYLPPIPLSLHLRRCFPSFIPPLSSHPQCSATTPSPPPHAPLTAYFCLICPHCKVDCYQRGESKAGPGSVSVIIIFNVINFNFQSFCPLFSSPPPPPSFSHGIPIMGICQFCFPLSFSPSFILTRSLQTPIGYYPVSRLPQTSATQNAIFSLPHP